MKASINKKIAVFCLSAVMAVGIGLGLSGIKTAQAHTSEKDIVLDSYKIDSVVEVSDDATTGVVFPKTVQISDTEIASAYVITYPDGVTVSLKDGILLDQIGLYTVAYKSVVGGVANVYSDTFKVYKSFSNNQDLVELYDKNVYSSYVTNQNFYGKYDPNSPTDDATVKEVIKGVRTELSAGTKVTFNNLINVNNVRADGFCELAIFNADSVNRVENALRFGAIDLTFTDVADSNNYFKLTGKCATANIGYYFGVSTAKLPFVGTRDSGVDSSVEKPGKQKIFYVNGIKNVAYFDSSNAGTYGSGEQDLYDYKVLYNPETQEIAYECIKRFNFSDGKTNVITSDVIVDLNNPDIYDDGAELFNGFLSGEVRLTVEARDFTESSAYFDVFGLGDVQYQDLQACYINDAVNDNKAPEIRINVNETDSNGVYTIYDSTNPIRFKLPSATAIDASECSEITARVYKNYSSDSKIFVPVNNDGTFTVSEKVIYTIEYKASDVFGNVGVKTLRVVPRDATELVEGDIKINQGIQAVFDKMQLTTGKLYDGEVLKYLNTVNISSDLKVKVSVINGEDVVFLEEYGYDDFAGEDKPLFSLKPLSAGTYKVTYEFSDNVDSLVYSYEVNCVSTGLVDFAGAPLLQRYYMLGMTYAKTDFTAYKFGNTVSENSTDMYVSYDEGANWTKVNQTFVLGMGSDGHLLTNAKTVKFKYVSAGVEDYITESAPIVDVRTDESIANNDLIRVKQQRVNGETIPGNLDQVKYFVGENVNVSKSTKNTVVSKATVNSGNAVTRFINPLSVDTNGSLYFEFTTDAQNNNYEEIIVRYIDAYDPTNFATVKLFLLKGATRISINGSKDVDAGVNLHGTQFQTNLSLVNKQFSYGANKFDLDFNPTNKLFYIELEMGAINGDNAELTLNAIGNHKFQLTRTFDNSAPMIYYESVAGSYSLGSEVVIKTPQVVDILTPYVHTLSDGTNRTKISVTKNKKPITVNGVKLDGTQDPTKDYVIKLSEYATWDVRYEVSDEAGLSQSPIISFSAIDVIAPTIELNYGFNADTIHNVTLGKTFSIEYSVTDNLTEVTKLKTSVFIVRDSDYFNVYTSEPFEVLTDRTKWANITDSCIITRKGMYTVYIFAMDEDFNTSYSSYKLNVQ